MLRKGATAGAGQTAVHSKHVGAAYPGEVIRTCPMRLSIEEAGVESDGRHC